MTSKNQIAKVTTGAFLIVLGTAEVGRPITTPRAPSNYIVPPGELSGVGQLFIGNQSGDIEGVCTGSLLRDTYFLSAAHCLTDEQGNLRPTDAVVRFPDLPNEGEFASFVTDYFINPEWTGNSTEGNDLAVLKLDQAAPTEVERYNLYQRTNEVGLPYTLVGYGGTGTGNTGVTSTVVDLLEAGEVIEKRSGQNRIDVVDTQANILFSDFDNGNSANNFFGVNADVIEPTDIAANLSDTGLGTNEVGVFEGDSGGPGLINNQIAGVASFVFGCSDPDVLNICATDVDETTNGSFGELIGYARVSDDTDFVNDAISGRIPPTTPSVPEPTSGLWALGIGVGFVLSRQQQQ